MYSTNYGSKSIDHLGLVAGFCESIGLQEYIDNLIPKKSNQSGLSHGTLLTAMILNGLGFVSRTLHMYPEYFSEKATEHLLGSGVMPEQLNDDATGRSLEAFYDEGVSKIYAGLALKVTDYLGLDCKSMNMDTTSFHTDGQYEQDIDAQCIKITKGYSRDHRPELNQVVLNLLTENQAGIPLYMQACSGNANDMETFKQLVKSHLSSLKAAYNNTYLIGDAALYTEECIRSLSEQEQLFITRVPQKLVEAKSIIQQASNVDWEPLENGYSGSWFSSSYGGVSQRWLLVRSQQAKKRESSILHKAISRDTELAVKSFKKLCHRSFACDKDASKALSVWLETQKFVSVENVHFIENTKQDRRGRPSPNSPVKITYQISGNLCTNLNLCEEAEQGTGLFILATNDLSDGMSMQFLLDEYKSQQAVERGFRFLKSPEFLTSSLYLKKPERIESLLMVMTCSLMVYAAIEHLIRIQLVAKAMFFPDMKKKPTQKPTARWVFSCFQGIDLLTVNNRVNLVINLTDRHKIILGCLGENYWKYYS